MKDILNLNWLSNSLSSRISWLFEPLTHHTPWISNFHHGKVWIFSRTTHYKKVYFQFYYTHSEMFEWLQWKVTDWIPLTKVACHDQWSLPEENLKSKNLNRNSETMPYSICVMCHQCHMLRWFPKTIKQQWQKKFTEKTSWHNKILNTAKNLLRLKLSNWPPQEKESYLNIFKQISCNVCESLY